MNNKYLVNISFYISGTAHKFIMQYGVLGNHNFTEVISELLRISETNMKYRYREYFGREYVTQEILIESIIPIPASDRLHSVSKKTHSV